MAQSQTVNKVYAQFSMENIANTMLIFNYAKSLFNSFFPKKLF